MVTAAALAQAGAGAHHTFVDRGSFGALRNPPGLLPSPLMGMKGSFRTATAATMLPGNGPGTIGPLPRVLVGSTPQEAAFDPATRTVYVANAGDNTLSVVDARTCNADDSAGCGQTPPTVAAGSGATAVAIDQARTRSMSRTPQATRSR